jgi:hypothetical protein
MSNPRVETDTYDRKLVPAETAARKEREGDTYKQVPENQSTDLDTEGGYTVDREGLLNNYPIEPEMYIEEPGDLREEEEEAAARRQQELAEINQTNEAGRVGQEGDRRGKGVGKI